MRCPPVHEIEKHKYDQRQLAIWYRFCDVNTDEDVKRINLICEYFKGFDAMLSKQIGWDEDKYL